MCCSFFALRLNQLLDAAGARVSVRSEHGGKNKLPAAAKSRTDNCPFFKVALSQLWQNVSMTQGAGVYIQESQQTSNSVSEETNMLSAGLWRREGEKNNLMGLLHSLDCFIQIWGCSGGTLGLKLG